MASCARLLIALVGVFQYARLKTNVHITIIDGIGGIRRVRRFSEMLVPYSAGISAA